MPERFGYKRRLMDVAQPAHPAAADAPDWETQQSEICCPMCEYNLRGLTEPRCPECGYHFAWKDLLDARIRPHPYLFEHHPERNFKSFWRTAWGGLRPWKFWRELHPAMPSRPGRLRLYRSLIILSCALAVLAIAIVAAIQLALAAKEARQTSPGAPQGLLDLQYPLPPRWAFFEWLLQLRPELFIFGMLLFLYLAWPTVTFGVLMLFGSSMRRARIKPIHVKRCIVYSFDAGLWVGIAALIAFPIYCWIADVTLPTNRVWTSTGLRGYESELPFQTTYWDESKLRFMHWSNAIVAALLLFCLFRLTVAYRRYLRFHWPIVTVIASQLILLLLMLQLTFLVRSPLTGYWRYMMGIPVTSRR